MERRMPQAEHRRDMELTVGHKSEEKVVNEIVTEKASGNNTSGMVQETNLANMRSRVEKTFSHMTPLKIKKCTEALNATNPVLDTSNPVKNTEDRQPYTPILDSPAVFPSLDPRVNYPVFPPVPRPPSSGFAEQNPHTMLPKAYPYQNLTNQASFPQGFPMQFPMQKINTPNYYNSPLPTYSPWGVIQPSHLRQTWHCAEGNPNNMASHQTLLPPYVRPINIQPAVQHLQYTPAGCMPFNDLAVHKSSAHTAASITPTITNKTPTLAEAAAMATDAGAVMAPDADAIMAPSTVPAAVATYTAPAATVSNNTVNKVSSDIRNDKRTDTINVQSEDIPAADDSNKKSKPVVQILTQALVDGAIGAASTAYSTAWNALENLKSTEDNEIEFDPVFENNMALLVDMGFNNLERNARLLKRFDNDISQVIGVICATGGAHNLDID